MPHRRPSQNFSGHVAGWRSVSQKYNVTWSPDQYPCLVLGLVYRELEKKLWALSFWNYRSLINTANFRRESLPDTISHRLLFLSFPYKFLSVNVGENRAPAVPKDRGRPFTFIFLQYKSYPKRLTTMTFAEVGVRFSSRYHHFTILASQASRMIEISGNFRWA